MVFSCGAAGWSSWSRSKAFWRRRRTPDGGRDRGSEFAMRMKVWRDSITVVGARMRPEHRPEPRAREIEGTAPRLGAPVDSAWKSSHSH